MFVHKNSIIEVSNQTKKWNFFMSLFLGSSAIMFLVIATTFDFGIGPLLLSLLDGYVWFVLLLVSLMLIFIALLGLCLAIKCPRCSLRWFWYGMAKDFKRDIMIGWKSSCPLCGYPEKEKEVKATLKSKHAILEVSNQNKKYRYMLAAFFTGLASVFVGITGLVYYEKLFDFWRVCFFGGIIGAGSVLISLWVSIQCPQCGLRWYWYAFSKNMKYLRMRRISHCPRCNYPEAQP